MAVDCMPHAAYAVRCVGTYFRSEPVVKPHDVRTGMSRSATLRKVAAKCASNFCR